MTEGEGGRHTVTFLPWLKLSASAEVNDVAFWPFPAAKDRFHLNEDLETQLRRIFDSYKDLLGNPIGELAIVSFRNEPFKDLLPEEAEKIAELTRLLSFSVMAENDYYRQGGRCFNSSHFQHFHQRFQLGSAWIAPQSRRRDGITWHGGYKHGELRFTQPLQAVTTHEAKPNLSFLHSLIKYLDEDTPEAAAVRQAISWFFLANSDSDSVSRQTEIIMMGSAFEALLEVQDEKGKKSALMDRLPKLFGGRRTIEVEREGTDGNRVTRSWKVWWIDEFYWLRNKIIHGGNNELERMTWDLDEHLTIAAMILAVGVKLRITEKGFYALTSNDEVCADSIDCFMADGNLSEEKLLDAQQDARLDRAAERAWEDLHREDKPT